MLAEDKGINIQLFCFDSGSLMPFCEIRFQILKAFGSMPSHLTYDRMIFQNAFMFFSMDLCIKILRFPTLFELT